MGDKDSASGASDVDGVDDKTNDKKTNDGKGEGDPGADDGDVKNPAGVLLKNKQLLTEKKKLELANKELSDKLALIERKDLENQGNHKAIAEAEKKRADEWEKKYGSLDNKVKESVKLTSFLSALPGKVDKKYHGLVMKEFVKEIQLEGDYDVNETTLQAAVTRFEKTYPEILQKQGMKMPNDAAKGGASLTYEQWLALPATDRKKRVGEVKA